MDRSNLMESQIRDVFDGVEECLNSNASQKFYIVEDKVLDKVLKKSTISSDATDGFEIINPSLQSIKLLAIDGCLLKDFSGKKCDCVIFDNNDFCFVELKLNVSEFKQATTKLQDARKQLASTIILFREAFTKSKKDFLQFKLEAYVVMKENVYPKNRASRMFVLVEFFENTGVPLFEKNQKIFTNKN